MKRWHLAAAGLALLCGLVSFILAGGVARLPSSWRAVLATGPILVCPARLEVKEAVAGRSTAVEFVVRNDGRTGPVFSASLMCFAHQGKLRKIEVPKHALLTAMLLDDAAGERCRLQVQLLADHLPAGSTEIAGRVVVETDDGITPSLPVVITCAKPELTSGGTPSR